MTKDFRSILVSYLTTHMREQSSIPYSVLYAKLFSDYRNIGDYVRNPQEGDYIKI